MTAKGKKTRTTILIIIMSFLIYGAYMYLMASDGKYIPSFTGVAFAFIPALLINIIWNRKSKKSI